MTTITETIMIHSREFVLRKFGQAGWAAVEKNLDDATRRLYARTLDVNGWTDFSHVRSLLCAIDEALKGQNPSVLFELGLNNSEANLRLTQKIIMKITSVTFVLKMASFLWSGRVRNGGSLEVKTIGDKRVRARLIAFPDPVEAWQRYLTGWFVRTVQLSGGKDVKAELVHVSTSPAEPAEWLVTYR